jgi:hypothetical protein
MAEPTAQRSLRLGLINGIYGEHPPSFEAFW